MAAIPVYGLTLTGFVIPSVDDIRTEIEGLLRTTFGASLPLGDNTLLGYMVGIVSERLALLWEFAQAAWSALDPNAATGIALEALALLTGTLRLAAASSVAVITLCGTDGTVVPTNAVIQTASTLARFQTIISAIITSLDAWAPSTAYTIVGARVTNAGQCYQVSVAGTSAGSGGPTITAAGSTTDNTVTWIWIGTGAAAVDVTATSLDTGVIVAVAGDLTSIANPQGGLNTAYNILDAVVGNPVQTDQDLRLSREEELSQDGASTPDAIRAAILKVTGVTACHVFYNPGDTVDGNGLPPHSVRALVQGGADQDLWDVLGANVAGGIGMTGTATGTFTDSEGNSQPAAFTRATPIAIYWYVTLSYNALTYIGDTALKAQIVLAANTRPIGTDAVARSLNALLFPNGTIDAQTLIYTDAIQAPVAWLASTAYSATPGSRSVVTNDGGRAYICITSGTSASSGGPSGVGANITDGAAHWAFLDNSITIDNQSLATYDTNRTTIVSTPGTL